MTEMLRINQESFVFPYVNAIFSCIISCSSISKEMSSTLKLCLKYFTELIMNLQGDSGGVNVHIDSIDVKAYPALANGLVLVHTEHILI